MSPEEKYNNIERYLDGELNQTEQQQFEQALQSDTALREELDLHRELSETLRGERIHALRNVLKKTDASWQMPAVAPTSESGSGQAKVVRRPFRRWVAAAAAAVVLLMATLFWWSNDGAGPRELYAANFESYPMTLNQRSTDANNDTQIQLNEAIAAYDQGDYASAEAGFADLAKAEPNNMAYQFYRAISQLGAGQGRLAATGLASIANSD
ncbi:MAG: hypothetical protein AAFO94_05900, partial [Bacteroidota bacterium]